jgi:hypothetical protein
MTNSTTIKSALMPCTVKEIKKLYGALSIVFTASVDKKIQYTTTTKKVMEAGNSYIDQM